MKSPQFTVFDDIVIKPDFVRPQVDWDRLRLWYTGLPSTTDESGSMRADLPQGFCLINVPQACLVETGGVQVPKYAALSYV